MRGLVLLAAALLVAGPSPAQESSGIAVRQAQAEAERTRRELDRAITDTRAQAAADQARIAREQSDRLAAESRREQALAAEHARRQGQLEAQSQAARTEADLVRRNAEQRARAADEEVRRLETLQRRLETVRDVPAPEPPIYLPRRRQAPTVDARRQAETDRPIAMKEGVVLCERDAGKQWRCTGPSAVTYGELDADRRAVAGACGGGTTRSLGTIRGFRAFGCGFGLNPRSAAAGNRDVPALFGIEVPGRAVFRCPASIDAFCRHR